MAGGPFHYSQSNAGGFVIELFVPKQIAYLGGIYSFLKAELESPNSGMPGIEGFSMYEVYGAFRGTKLYSEDTLVVRVFFDKASLLKNIENALDPEREALEALEKKVGNLLNQIAVICNNDEEQIWAIRQSDIHVYKLMGSKLRAKGRRSKDALRS